VGPLQEARLTAVRRTATDPAIMDFELAMEHSPMSIELVLQPCGGAWKLARANVTMRPAAPLRVSRADVAEMLQDAMEERMGMRVVVSCPGPSPVAVKPGAAYGCRARDEAGTAAHAVITFTDLNGAFRYEAWPSGKRPAARR
jgi:hypothetical protein